MDVKNIHTGSVNSLVIFLKGLLNFMLNFVLNSAGEKNILVLYVFCNVSGPSEIRLKIRVEIRRRIRRRIRQEFVKKFVKFSSRIRQEFVRNSNGNS